MVQVINFQFSFFETNVNNCHSSRGISRYKTALSKYSQLLLIVLFCAYGIRFADALPLYHAQTARIKRAFPNIPNTDISEVAETAETNLDQGNYIFSFIIFFEFIKVFVKILNSIKILRVLSR